MKIDNIFRNYYEFEFEKRPPNHKIYFLKNAYGAQFHSVEKVEDIFRLTLYQTNTDIIIKKIPKGFSEDLKAEILIRKGGQECKFKELMEQAKSFVTDSKKI